LAADRTLHRELAAARAPEGGKRVFFGRGVGTSNWCWEARAWVLAYFETGIEGRDAGGKKKEVSSPNYAVG